MQTETALAAKLKRAGFIPCEVEFRIAVAKFKKNGGDVERAFELVGIEYADELESKGFPRRADKAIMGLPSLRTNAAVGQVFGADKAIWQQPTAAAKKMPGHAKRGAAAMASVQKPLAKSLFDSIILPDGRTLRQIHWSEVPNLISKYGRASRILAAIHNHGVPVDPNATLDTLVSEDELKRIVEAVERLNDIH